MRFLPTIYALSVVFGVGSGQEFFNHAQAFAGPIVTGPESAHQSGQKNGNLVLVNQCDYDLFAWSAWPYKMSDMIKIPARSAYRRELITGYLLPHQGNCIDNCGVTYHIAKEPKLVGGPGGNEVQFEYSTKLGVMYFDISFVNCVKGLGYRTGDASNCPAWAEGIRVEGQKHPSPFHCQTVECLPGQMCIGDGNGAYWIDTPWPTWNLRDPVKICPAYQFGFEIYVRFCSKNSEL